MKDKIKQKSTAETKLYALWRGLCLAKKTTNDRRLKGVYAGQLNTTCGPDYQGAEFDLDDKRYRGDVEIHCKIKDWFAHGHHLDWRYDNVLLHLTAEETCSDNIITNSKGLSIPSLSFHDFPDLPIKNKAEYYCKSSGHNYDQLITDLKRLAGYRLKEKVNIYRRVISGDGFDQGLYRLIFRMLGRGQNADIYDRIALMLPWSTIQQIKHRYHPDKEFWESILLTFAGFSLTDPQKKIKAIPGLTDQPPIPRQAWQFAGLRPPAHPVRRLKGMAAFIINFKGDGLFEYILQKSMQRLSFENMLHFYKSLANSIPGKTNKVYWGESLAVEITGNVILPAMYYYSDLSESDGFTAYIEDFYFWLPATPIYGALNGFQTWMEFSELPEKFYMRQALLWLRQNYCQLSLCDHCPLHRVPERV